MEAWNPSGLRSAWIVAAGSSTPRPAYVLISGWRAASPGAMIADSSGAKLWNPPAGVGSDSTSGLSRAAWLRSRGAVARSVAMPLRFSV
jgi:hypothetical protein